MRVGVRWVLPAVALLVVSCGGAGTGFGEGANSTSAVASTEPSLQVTTTVGPVAITRLSPSSTIPPSATTSTSRPGVVGPTSAPAGWARGEVVRVVDGDTIEVRLEAGTTETVRLIGTNSPEGGECYANEATSGLADLIDGEMVYLEPDLTNRDQFGRLLRYVWTTDERLVNAVTVEEGWALAREYPPDTARSAQLESAQNRASSSGAGLWAPDACGSSSPSDVQIVHVEYDAAGNDNFNLNGEWVEIANSDDVPVELTGWVLKDESATHRYSFPGGFALTPGSSVRVFTGCGDDSRQALYWCVSGSAVWNNSGDTAFLLDPGGNIVYSLSYG
jgi:micrococcal nuclease